jgi:Na+/H+ antiporter NhaC
VPPLWTLAVALATKQVTVALVCGIWSGCMLLHDLHPLVALLRTFDTHVVDAITDREHATVILFNLLLGGTIGLVQKGGGALGLARALKRFATDARSFQRTAACLAACIFFDDYASVLIVGNSFRPLLPLVGACREKFAMVLHFVAVAVSASMPVSSWVGMQVGCASVATAAIRAVPGGVSLPDPFVLTMRSLPYRLFPLALAAFVGALLATDKDFGPMAAAVQMTTASAPGAEGATAQGSGTAPAAQPVAPAPAAPALASPPGSLEPKAGAPLRAANALLPFGALVGGTLAGMVVDGRRALAAVGGTSGGLLAALSAGNNVQALLWGAVGGITTALGLVLGQRVLTLPEAMEAAVAGVKDVVEPVVVLGLAWGLGGIMAQCGTADFIARGLTDGGLPAWALAPMVALLSYAMSFATGSSFGTMGMLFPLVGPLAWRLGHGSLSLLLHCFGAAYGGALFGNVFSPIADTSILTALATKTNLQVR